MPIYEYRCQECGKQFEMFRRFSDADSGILCPECASDQVRRILSSFAAGGCGGGGRFT
jgi:putative FmdB family regulatory protein